MSTISTLKGTPDRRPDSREMNADCPFANSLGCLPSRTGVFAEPLGSAPDARASFLLLRQKKGAKEKATPGYAVGYADSPALLGKPGGCATRGCAPQTVLADCPRLASVARRCTRGYSKPSEHTHHRIKHRSVFLLPSASSSSAGRNGKRGEDCLRAAGPCSADPRCTRAAQSTRQRRATQRARLLLGYFFLARQEDVPRLQAKQRVSATTHARDHKQPREKSNGQSGMKTRDAAGGAC